MRNIILTVTIFMKLSLVSCYNSCPSLCNCGPVEVTCRCKPSAPRFDLLRLPSTCTELTIKHCEEVWIHDNPFNEMVLDKIDITDTGLLVIQDVNFMGISRVKKLSFVNIANLTMMTNSLYSLKADSFVLKNVTIDIFRKYTLPGAAGISEMIITDSKIGTIETHAIHVEKDRSFEIVDSRIQFIDNSSICVDNVEWLSFRGNVITAIAEDAFHLLNVEKLVITGNNFHTTSDGSFLANFITEFIFARNHLRRTSSRTFYHMQNIKSMTFSHNKFRHCEKDAILMSVNVQLPQYNISTNEFFCDCELEWLFFEKGFHKFKKFFETSVCFGPDNLSGMALHQVTPIWHPDSQQCLSVNTLQIADSVDQTSRLSLESEYCELCDDENGAGAPISTPLTILVSLLLGVVTCYLHL